MNMTLETIEKIREIMSLVPDEWALKKERITKVVEADGKVKAIEVGGISLAVAVDLNGKTAVVVTGLHLPTTVLTK